MSSSYRSTSVLKRKWCEREKHWYEIEVAQKFCIIFKCLLLDQLPLPVVQSPLYEFYNLPALSYKTQRLRLAGGDPSDFPCRSQKAFWGLCYCDLTTLVCVHGKLLLLSTLSDRGFTRVLWCLQIAAGDHCLWEGVCCTWEHWCEWVRKIVCGRM